MHMLGWQPGYGKNVDMEMASTTRVNVRVHVARL